jgi:hypothetical protein
MAEQEGKCGRGVSAKLVRGVVYAPDSSDSEEHATSDYDDSGGYFGSSGSGSSTYTSDHDVAEALSYLASLPEPVFRFACGEPERRDLHAGMQN